VLPHGEEGAYAEHVVRLPGCYQANDALRPIAAVAPTRAEAGLPASGFVFCCFNNGYKIVPQVFDVWMRLLQRVGGSVLWLFEDNADAVRNLRREAMARGVAPDRLVFATRLPADRHLARHRLADLFLDTLPYNAHTTASDALWAGLPLVTATGTTFPGRVATSLLRAVGLPELVTSDLAAYEALAFELATSPARLAAIRERLAVHRSIAPLFDTARFVRHLELAFETMVTRARRGEPPAAFDVPPSV
jgi:predicted O-linked N-acetylglucosamine transferase (SPINDLY family)